MNVTTLMQRVYLDVSDLAPPEPMTHIITALASLTAQQCLVIKHSREPFPLYEKLQAAGWAYHCHKSQPSVITLYIYRANAQAAFMRLLKSLALI